MYDSTQRCHFLFLVGWKPASPPPPLPPELSPDGFRRETWEESLCLFRHQRRQRKVPFSFFLYRGFLCIVFYDVTDCEMVARLRECISLIFRHPAGSRNLWILLTPNWSEILRCLDFPPSSFLFFFTDGNLSRLSFVWSSSDWSTKSVLEMSLTFLGRQIFHSVSSPRRRRQFDNLTRQLVASRAISNQSYRNAWGRFQVLQILCLLFAIMVEITQTTKETIADISR